MLTSHDFLKDKQKTQEHSGPINHDILDYQNNEKFHP